MNTLDIAISCGLNPKKVASTNGGEYASPCPMCGGRDRFRVWPYQDDHGRWWCRRCGRGGDAIQLLREARGMGFREAAAAVGRDVSPVVPAPPRPAIKKTGDWRPRRSGTAGDTWREKASAFVAYTHTALLGNRGQLAWLAERGITEKTARRFRLGWHSEDRWRRKNLWGLDDNGKKLWLPRGLVIPWIMDNDVHRIRIRRPEGDPRYYVVPGSSMSVMAIRRRDGSGTPADRTAWVVVESELDAILIAQDAGDLVGVIALGNSSSRPDESVHHILLGADCILVALDADTAGAMAWKWWRERYPQADRWPVPEGKDPGDYRKAGGDLCRWILAGLPPGLRPAPRETGSRRSNKPAPRTETTKQARPQPGASPVLLACPSCGRKIEYVFFSRVHRRVPCSACLLGKKEVAA